MAEAVEEGAASEVDEEVEWLTLVKYLEASYSRNGTSIDCAEVNLVVGVGEDAAAEVVVAGEAQTKEAAGVQAVQKRRLTCLSQVLQMMMVAFPLVILMQAVR